MDIKPIRTKADYRAALKQIEKLMGAKANSADGEKLDVLATLVEAYERTRRRLTSRWLRLARAMRPCSQPSVGVKAD